MVLQRSRHCLFDIWLLTFLLILAALPNVQGKERHDSLSPTTYPLSKALVEYARAINKNIVYNPLDVAKFVVPSLVIHRDEPKALGQLLKGTPLVAQPIESGWIILPQNAQTDLPTAATNSMNNSKETTIAEVIVQEPRVNIDPEQPAVYRSLLKSKASKRNALTIRDSLIAEGLTQFPELNLADSLQRIPGVAITKESGEGRQISVRGMSSDFLRVTVNGMESLGISASALDAKGSVSRTRGFDFNIFATELFHQIDVSKTYSASSEEGGTGASIHLMTAKPSDFDRLTRTASIQVNYNDISHSITPRYAGLISQQWAKWGVLLSVAYNERHTQEYGSNTTRWRQETNKLAADPTDIALQTLLDTNQLWFPRGHRYSLWDNRQRRLGLTSAIEFTPDSRTKLVFETLYAKLNNDIAEHHSAVKDNNLVRTVNWHKVNGQQEVDFVQYQNATWRNENTRRQNTSAFSHSTINLNRLMDSHWSVDALLGYSQSTFSQPQVVKTNVQAKEKANITTDFTQDRYYGKSYSTDFDYLNWREYELKDIYFQSDRIENRFANGQLNFTYAKANSDTTRFGLNIKRFDNNAIRLSQDNAQLQFDSLKDGLTENNFNVYHQHPNAVWLEGNIEQLLALYNLSDFTLDEDTPLANAGTPLSEKTYAVFLEQQLNTDWFGRALEAQFGVRYFQSSLSTQGVFAGKQVQTRRHYHDLLPAIHLRYDLTSSVVFRAALNQNITRPSLDLLSYQANVSRTSGDAITNITMGNPSLNPLKSSNVDVGAEWYFNDIGFASVGLFFKEIDNFIVTRSRPVIYSTLGLPDALLPDDKTPDSVFYLEQPENKERAIISGVEVAFAASFSSLPAPLNQLGMVANYTYSNGKTRYRDLYGVIGNDQQKAFIGLSKHSYNLSFFYETTVWGVKASMVYRGPFLDSVTSNTDQDESGYHASRFIDMTAFWQFGPHLTLTFEGLNLTNQREELYSDSNDRQYNTSYTGRTYLLGFNFSF